MRHKIMVGKPAEPKRRSLLIKMHWYPECKSNGVRPISTQMVLVFLLMSLSRQWFGESRNCLCPLSPEGPIWCNNVWHVSVQCKTIFTNIRALTK
jgi:hypothetical protein